MDEIDQLVNSHSLQMKAAQDEKAAIEEQVATESAALAECDSLSNEVEVLKKSLSEMSASKEELHEEYLQLRENKDEIISEKMSLAVEVVEKTALISSLEAQNDSLLSVMKELEAKNLLMVEEVASIDKQRADAININRQNGERVQKLESKANQATVDLHDALQQREDLLAEHKSSCAMVAELNSNIEHFKAQIAYERKGRSDLMGEKLVIEKQLGVTRDERDQLSSELKGLKDQLSAVTAERESTRLLLDDAYLRMELSSNRIQELEQQLFSRVSDSLTDTMSDKSDLIASRDCYQEQATKLAITVIKLKMQCKRAKEKRQQSTQLPMQDEQNAHRQVVRDLERSVAMKDEEIQQLQAKVMNKTGTIVDLRQQNKHLMNENANITTELESKEEVNVSLRMEKDELKGQLDQAKDALLELHAAFDEVLQEKSHLSTEIDSLHNKITELETEVIALENQTKANEKHIFNVESQLASKANEADMLIKAVNSHEETLNNLRTEISSLEEQKADVEGMLSALHCKMDLVVGDRDDLASQLDKAIKELERIRVERDSLVAKETSDGKSVTAARLDHVHVADSGSETKQNEDSFKGSPRKQIREILSASAVSEEDIDRICEKMSQLPMVVAKIEQERKLLKKQVSHLRAGLERTQDELVTAKKDYKKVSRQTLALRDVVSQAKSLLEKTEAEKNKLALDLEKARKVMKRSQQIHRHSEQSYSESQDEINRLKMELKQKDESIECLLSSSNSGNPKSANNISKYDITPKVRSKERFKIEKGSMLRMLDMNKSGRKDRVKYRQFNG